MSYYNQIFANEMAQQEQQNNQLAAQAVQGLTPQAPQAPAVAKPAVAPVQAPAVPTMSDRTNKIKVQSAARNTINFLRLLQGTK